MWVNHLWPFAKEQDGVFVQLQAAVHETVASGSKKASKATKNAGGGGGNHARDVGTKGSSADQKGSTAAALGKLWFLRLGERVEGEGWRSRAPSEIPYDLSLLPAVLR